MEYLFTRQYPISLIHVLPEDYVDRENPLQHGHDYKLQVTVKGSPHATSGQLIDRDQLDQTVKRTLLDKYHKTLINAFFDCGTGEAICIEFFRELKKSELGDRLISVQLVETRKNRFQGFETTSDDKT